jgi:hypothetical protein
VGALSVVGVVSLARGLAARAVGSGGADVDIGAGSAATGANVVSAELVPISGSSPASNSTNYCPHYCWNHDGNVESNRNIRRIGVQSAAHG